MAVRILVHFQALPGKGDEFAKARMPRHVEVRKDRGCEQFDLFRNVENPDQFMLVERWTDQESLDAHYAINRPQVATELRAPGPGRQEKYIVD